VAKSVRGTVGVLARWDILKVAAKAKLLGTVEAASEAEAIKIGAERFGQDAETLMAVKRA
jgi:hypothetical protein